MAEHRRRRRTRLRGLLLATVLVLTPAATQTALATSPDAVTRAETGSVSAPALPSAARARSGYDKAVLTDKPVGF